MDRLGEHYVLMAHFAQIESGVVVRVVAVHNNDAPDEASGQAFLAALFGPGKTWVQTSYNGNQRKNFAGIGHTYDAVRDAFIPPSPFPSWVLNENTCRYEAPVPYPTDDGRHAWDESSLAWVAG